MIPCIDLALDNFKQFLSCARKLAWKWLRGPNRTLAGLNCESQHGEMNLLFARFKHLIPPGLLWRRLFETWRPFTARLTVSFPNDGRLHVLNAAAPVSARKARVFMPICRDFDRDAPLRAAPDFNHQVIAEDKAFVEKQFPEDLPINLQGEVHIRADKSFITYRQDLARLGLGRSFTA